MRPKLSIKNSDTFWNVLAIGAIFFTGIHIYHHGRMAAWQEANR